MSPVTTLATQVAKEEGQMGNGSPTVKLDTGSTFFVSLAIAAFTSLLRRG
jgi:hypothetical protein